MAQQSVSQRSKLGVKTSTLIEKVIVTTIMIVVAALFLIPFLWMISTSLKPDLKAVFQFPPQWIPNPPAFGNYIKVWQSAPFGRYLLNSIVVAVAGTAFQLINACLAAYVFARIKFPGRNLFFILFLAVLMIPSQVIVVPNYIILSRLPDPFTGEHMLNSYWALILPFIASAYGTFMIRQAFMTIPNDLVDAAVVDGANHLGILRNVMLPLTKPMLITFGLLAFNWRWNDYFWPLIMTNSVAMRTLPVGVVAMRAGAEGGTNWHYIMAATVLVIAPIVLLFSVAQRYFVEGIAYSGLKGV